jgi:hypothetical protein
LSAVACLPTPIRQPDLERTMRTDKFIIPWRHHTIGATAPRILRRQPSRLPIVSPTTAIGRAVHRLLWLLRME